MQKSMILMRDIRKSYYLTNREEISVLRGICLDIKTGEFVALMGESGSGKSTLLNIIGCLHYSNSGRFEFEGEDLSDLKDDEVLSHIRNRKIGFIFQQFHLIPKLTALENVILPSLYLPLSQAEKQERATMLLRKVGLGDRMGNRPGELSG